MTLADALMSGRWFTHERWLSMPLEPYAFRWLGGRWEKALRSDLSDSKITERRFHPGEVLSTGWLFVDDAPEARVA